jgi:hypothetical protein
MSKTEGMKHLRPVKIKGDEMRLRFLFWSFEFKSLGFVSARPGAI